MLDFTFNGVRASEMGLKVMDIKHSVMPAIRDQYELIAGRHGSYLFPQTYGDRIVSIDCLRISSDFKSVRQDIFPISAWLNTSNRKKLELNDTPDKYYMAKLANSGDLDRFLYTGTFTLEFNCEPFAYSIDDVIMIYTMESGTTQGICYNGTAETSPSITITAAYGDIVSPKITINDVSLVYLGTIVSGGQIDINSNSFTVYKRMDRDIMTTGAYDPAEDSVLAFIDGEFPILKPDRNIMVYSSDNDISADIKIQYQERWI